MPYFIKTSIHYSPDFASILSRYESTRGGFRLYDEIELDGDSSFTVGAGMKLSL